MSLTAHPMMLASALLLLAGTGQADPSQATLDALEVPRAVDAKIEVERIAREDLPAGLLEAMRVFDWGGQSGEIPDPVEVQIVDLNLDRSPEYFAKTLMGGSGGPLYLVFSNASGTWKCIGESGNFRLLPKKNGWHPIVSFGRSGPTYFKHFYEFDEGLYRHVETHEILDGEVTRTRIEVGEPDDPAAAPEPGSGAADL